MAQAGKNAYIKIAGSGVTITDEPMSLVSGKIYEVTDRDRKIWDRNAAITVKDNGATVSATNIAGYHFLTGRIVFTDSYSVTGPVTVTVDYRPATIIAYIKELSITEEVELSDITNYGTVYTDILNSDNPSRRRQANLINASGDISGLFDTDDNQLTELKNNTSIIIEIQPSKLNAAEITVVEAKITSGSNTLNVENPNEISFSFESVHAVEYE